MPAGLTSEESSSVTPPMKPTFTPPTVVVQVPPSEVSLASGVRAVMSGRA